MSKSDVGKYEYLVERLLRNHANLRDDTGLLYAACIAEIRGMEYVKNTSLYNHFKFSGTVGNQLEKVPSIASVIRLSTKLQKKYPEIRGSNWINRQKHSKDYKEEIE